MQTGQISSEGLDSRDLEAPLRIIVIVDKGERSGGKGGKLIWS